MSEEKCFCHFAGFAVKDATARAAINSEAAAREAAINSEAAARGAAISSEVNELKVSLTTQMIQQKILTGMDISEKVTFEYDSESSTGADDLTKEIKTYNAVYSQLLGIVFFQFSFVAYSDIAAGTVIRFNQDKYLPNPAKAPFTNYIYTGENEGVTLEMSTAGPIFSIKNEMNSCMTNFNGWYFCAGAGEQEESV